MKKGKAMKKEFKKVNVLVTYVLETYPKTRNSDNLVYLKVIETLGEGNARKPISEIFLNRELLGLPCFESVSRARRKIQAEREDLKANPIVQDFRTEKEEQFREFYGCHD